MSEEKDSWWGVLPVVVMIGFLVFAAGCPKQVVVLPESRQVFLIPAGTEFRARTTKGGPTVRMVRDKDSYVVDAGYLLQLQKAANSTALGVPE